MDPIGASCISLYTADSGRIPFQKREDEKNLKDIVASCQSLSKYESKSLKSLLPQIIATIIAASFHIGNGISLAYSAVLISQIHEKNSDINSTKSEDSWMASVLIIVVPVASLICGVLMDNFGRLNTIKIAGIPGVLGWSLIAIAKNVPTIIIGRLLVGFSSAWGTSPAIVYISEIASIEIRGSLMSVAPVYVSLGMCLTYFLGWYIHWRTLAWICNVFIVIPCIMCMFIPESPAWLILKGRNEQARKSLNWISKYQPNPDNKEETLADMQLKQLIQEQTKKKEESAKQSSKGSAAIVREFMKPTGYKPIIFFLGIFTFQHFSGIYITMFYSISFIEEAGSSMNAYLASILIGFVRLVMSIVSTFLLKKFRRRSLMFVSTFGMAIFMFLSGLFTKWIQEGTTTMKWVPVACILFYVISSIIGLLPIPNMLIAELLPLEIRGIGYSIGYSICCTIMFAALQSYYTLNDLFGGAAHLQWFFSVTCIGGLVFSYIFMPETYNKKLSDITDYFNHNSVFIGHKKEPVINNVKENVNNNLV